MARVPIYGNRKVSTIPLPGARRTAQQEGAGVGEAMAGFGDTVGRVGLAFADTIVRAEREQADLVAMTTAERQLGQLEYLLLNAPDSGALQVTGKDTLALQQTVLESFDTQAGEIAKNLTSDRQRLAFERARENRRQSIQGEVNRHTNREMTAYKKGEAIAAIETAKNLAAVNAHNAPRIAEELQRIDTLLDLYGGALGLTGPEQLQLAKAEARSAVHVGVLNKLLSDPRTEKGDAQAYYAAAKDEIQADQQDDIERALHVDTTKAQAQQAFDTIEAQGGTFSEKREKAKAITDPEVRDATLQYIEHEELIQERQERDANEARSRNVYDVLDTGKGVRAIPSTTWAQMSGPERSAARSYANSLAENGTAAAIKTDYTALYDLITLSSVNPDQFLKTNLMGYRNKLSNGDLEQMMRKQSDMRGGGSGAQIFATEGVVSEIVEANARTVFGPDAGTAAWRRANPDASKRYDAYFRSVREAIDTDYPPTAGKRPSRADVQARADELAAESVGASAPWFGRNTVSQYAFETPTALNRIPLAERREIEAAIVRHFGAPAVTPELIIRMYEQKHGAAR